MEKFPKLIFDDVETDITISKGGLHLDSLFKLTYDFDKLKGAISALFSNQEKLLKKINKACEINNNQNKYIEYLQKNINENFTTKEEKEKLELKIKELDDKLKEIDDELTKSN